MKRIALFVVLWVAIAWHSVAQIKVEKFELLPTDLTANTFGTIKQDQNGEKAALVKIVTPLRGFTFEGGSLGIVATEEHTGEIWLYVPRGAKKLTIKHDQYGVALRDYSYPVAIEGGSTYEMLIDLGIGRYVNLTSQIAGSTIYIDDENCGLSPVNNRYLTNGSHVIRAVKDRYEGEETIFVSSEDQQGRVVSISQRDMSDHFGDVTMTVDNNADIYFKGNKVGTGQWRTQLREGVYTVETRKADCDFVQTSFTVVAQRQNDIKLNAPIQHTGQLRIYTRPNNVLVTPPSYDLSEPLTLPVGTYQLGFSRKGYVSQTHEYTVRHNQTTRDTVTLERVKYVKPLAFYFGAGYTICTLGGVTPLLGAVIKNHDIQAHYTFGLKSSRPVHAYSTDGNDNYLSTLSFKQHSFGLKYGYQFNLMRQLAITPQLGFTMDRLNAKVESGSGKYANGASACDIAIGVKLIFVPFQHCYIFAAPEYDVAVSKDDNYRRLTELSNVSAGGFMANVGLLVSF